MLPCACLGCCLLIPAPPRGAAHPAPLKPAALVTHWASAHPQPQYAQLHTGGFAVTGHRNDTSMPSGDSFQVLGTVALGLMYPAQCWCFLVPEHQYLSLQDVWVPQSCTPDSTYSGHGHLEEPRPMYISGHTSLIHCQNPRAERRAELIALFSLDNLSMSQEAQAPARLVLGGRITSPPPLLKRSWRHWGPAAGTGLLRRPAAGTGLLFGPLF